MQSTYRYVMYTLKKMLSQLPVDDVMQKWGYSYTMILRKAKKTLCLKAAVQICFDVHIDSPKVKTFICLFFLPDF